jgi:hypothetical protein
MDREELRMSMNDVRDDMAHRQDLERRDAMRRQREDDSPNWVLPAFLGVAILAGCVWYVMGGDRTTRTATTLPSETTGRSERAPTPPAIPTAPRTAPEAPAPR